MSKNDRTTVVITPRFKAHGDTDYASVGPVTAEFRHGVAISLPDSLVKLLLDGRIEKQQRRVRMTDDGPVTLIKKIETPKYTVTFVNEDDKDKFEISLINRKEREENGSNIELAGITSVRKSDSGSGDDRQLLQSEGSIVDDEYANAK